MYKYIHIREIKSRIRQSLTVADETITYVWAVTTGARRICASGSRGRYTTAKGREILRFFFCSVFFLFLSFEWIEWMNESIGFRPNVDILNGWLLFSILFFYEKNIIAFFFQSNWQYKYDIFMCAIRFHNSNWWRSLALSIGVHAQNMQSISTDILHSYWPNLFIRIAWGAWLYYIWQKKNNAGRVERIEYARTLWK